MAIQFVLAMRYLLGRRLRTSLTTLAVAFAALVIFSTNTMLPTMREAFQANILAASGQVDVTVTHKTGEAFSPSVLSRVRAVPGVRAAAGSLSRTINIPDGFFGHGIKVSAVSLVGIELGAAQSVRTYPVKEGRFLRLEDSDAAVITQSLADTLGLRVGDTLRLPTADGVARLTVVGLRPASTLPGNEEVLVVLLKAQKLLGLPNRINTIEANLAVTDVAQRAAIEDAIQAQLGKDYHLGALSAGSEIMTTLQTGQLVFELFGFLALFMGGFIIFNTFRTIVAERRHDIGMLRAVGASRRTIIGLFLVEGLLQGAVGTLIGLALGYLMAVGIVLLMAPVWTQFFNLSLSLPSVNAGLFITTIVLGVGVTLLAGLLPALTAARLTPLEALRPPAVEPEQRQARTNTLVGAALCALAALGALSGNVGIAALGALLFLIGLVLVGPALVKPLTAALSPGVAAVFAREGTGMLAEGNLKRQPGRAAITASATMIGLAIIVMGGGIVASTNDFALTILQKVLGSDYMLIPPSVGVWSSNVGASSSLADRLRSVPGVQAVSTMRFAMSESGGKSVSVLGIDPVMFPQVSGLNFSKGDAKRAFEELAAGRTMIANGIFASQEGINVGDVVRLSTPEGVQDYTVVAIAGDYFNMKIPSVYISHRNLRNDFHKSDDVFIQLNLASGVQPEEVEPKLKAIVASYPQFRLISRQAYFEEAKQTFSAALGTMYVLFSALALPSLIALLNTLAIGVIERTREIGMLRAIGATRKQVRRMVLAEALLLAAIGTTFGLAAGLYLSYVSVLGLSSFGYPIAYAFPISGLIAAIAIGLSFGALAALVPARQAASLDIVRALQYE